MRAAQFGVKCMNEKSKSSILEKILIVALLVTAVGFWLYSKVYPFDVLFNYSYVLAIFFVIAFLFDAFSRYIELSSNTNNGTAKFVKVTLRNLIYLGFLCYLII